MLTRPEKSHSRCGCGLFHGSWPEVVGSGEHAAVIRNSTSAWWAFISGRGLRSAF